MTTKTELSAGLQALKALADAIRELGSVPNGHLYAQVMAYFSIEAYTKAIDLLCNSGVIRKSGDVLHWNL